MEEKNERKYQEATYIREDMPVKEVKMMRKQSKIVMVFVAILIIAITMLIVAISGYFVYRDVTVPKLDKILEYMENKYGETFEVGGVDTKPWSSHYTKIELYSEKYGHDFTVITYQRNGKRIYKDNYVEILRREELNTAFQEVVSKVYKKSKVFVYHVNGGITLPEEMGKDTPVNDILSHPLVISYISLCVEAADSNKKDKQLNDLRLELKKRKWDTEVEIYYMQKGKVEQLTMENRKEVLTKKGNYYLYGYMTLSDDFEIDALEWRDYSE